MSVTIRDESKMPKFKVWLNDAEVVLPARSYHVEGGDLVFYQGSPLDTNMRTEVARFPKGAWTGVVNLEATNRYKAKK